MRVISRISYRNSNSPPHHGSADPITRSKDVRRGNKVSTGEVTRDHYLAHSFLGQVLAARYILVFLEMIAHLFALTARSYQGLFDNAGDKTCAITNLGRCLLCSRRQLHYLQGVPAQSVIFLGGFRKMNLSNLQCSKLHYLKTF